MKLIHGDCLEVMKQIASESIDLILCDMPYGTTKCKWDSVIDLSLLWKQYERIIKPNGAILLFAGAPFDKVLACSNLPLFRYEWIWEKTVATGFYNANKMPLKAHENILVFYKKLPKYFPQKLQNQSPVNSYTKRMEVQQKTELYGAPCREVSGGGSTERFPRSVLKFPKDTQKSSLHPTQKPIALLEYFIKTYTEEGDMVLDSCMGSCSTGVACINTNRNFIGIEKEEKYYNIAKKRMDAALEE